MIEFNRAELGRTAREAGFVRDTFEKVLRLKEVLAFCNSNELLKTHLALKGGTAINMTIFNLPRLSVDLDMDFMPNLPPDEMRTIRDQITETIRGYMSGKGYLMSRGSRFSHSLDSLLFLYRNAGGNRDNLKIELNYSLRSHIFTPVYREVLSGIFGDSQKVLTLAPMEIFAGKANALMSRAAARDLYDFNNMISENLFSETEYELLRKSIIFYATVSAETINKNFDTSAMDGLTFHKIKRELFPVLRSREARTHFDLESRRRQAVDFLKKLMVVTPDEKEYMDLFENKKYKPELLFDDETILENIREHPIVAWKMTH